MTSRFLKLPLADESNSPIIIQVSPKAGGHDLDLDLLATDGDTGYRGKLRKRDLAKLREGDYHGSAKEWEDCLTDTFVPDAEVELPEHLRTGLQKMCRRVKKSKKPSIAVVLQISVEGIESRIGSVELSSSPDATDAIELFDWLSSLADDCDLLRQQKTTSEERANSADKRITSLETQLNDLLEAKKEHDTQILTKFALLLNEKKLRIRMLQQQILEQNGPSQGKNSTKPPRKRKNESSPKPPSQHSTESDAFEAMEVDKVEEDDDRPDSVQSQQTDVESESEPELDQHEPSPLPTKKQTTINATSEGGDDDDADTETASEDEL